MVVRWIGRSAVFIIALMVMGSLPAKAFPVLAPWGSDTFGKAIHFTGTSKPGGSHNGAIQNIKRGQGGSSDSGIIMTPVGDGSYVCTATVYPGASYTYYFGFRNRYYEADTTTSFLTTAPNAERDQDANRARTITIPTTATHGYYIYNAYGDRSVIGYQGMDTSLLSTANPYLATLPDTAGTARINTTGDTTWANNSQSNIYGLDAIQVGDSSFTISWSYSMGGAEAFVPSVQGAKAFSTGAGYGSSASYGFRVLRCDSPTGGYATASFVDRTAAITGGDTNWSDNNTNAFDGQSVTDSSWPDTVSTVIYTILPYTAYQYYNAQDTTRQNFSGGYDTQTRNPPIRVFFLVEGYNEEKVFQNGSNVGTVYMTPYIDGERREDMRFPLKAMKVSRKQRTI